MEAKDQNNPVEKTLGSLDGIEKAGTDAFFYERLMMRLEKQETRIVALAPNRLWQAAACLAALVILNIFVWFRSSGNGPGNNSQQNNNPVAQEYLSYLQNTQF